MKGILEMNNDKNAVVVGCAKSGIAAAEWLLQKGWSVCVYDSKSKEALGSRISSLEAYDKVNFMLGSFNEDILNSVSLMVVSPGVPTSLPFIKKAIEIGIDVVSEIELAYRNCPAKIIAITGTNGKTTTTALTGEIIRASGVNTFVLGNIGDVFIESLNKIGKDDIVVLEVSSFQLELIKSFKPAVSVLLNITPDHLDRHKTVEEYTRVKCRIFENLTEDDAMIVNASLDIKNLQAFDLPKHGYFDATGNVKNGAWCENGDIYVGTEDKCEFVCRADEIFILGAHNLENALAAAGAAYAVGVDAAVIARTLKTFRGVEHRIEYVNEVEGVKYYNDSKGTNCDATICAIRAMKTPTALILGGYDKGGDFDALFEVIDNKIKYIAVIGATTDKIMQSANKYSYKNIEALKTFEEAVYACADHCEKGDSVLLSPACASWDMFDNYEQRGKIFKEIVGRIGEERN
ncbi:MAG: UDP-N-acetylmuramoyl-L-alanine--D-glutamate ligase [Clostridiales bacterium]|nr:UDP-N-acetylmuramoyl-L-alanine--D-glutamate ligase [Clostridiales bacterium]